MKRFFGLALLGASACASAPDQGIDYDSRTGIPNPAAAFCANRGGTYDLATGDCTLGNGTTVDAWEYFRSEYGG